MIRPLFDDFSSGPVSEPAPSYQGPECEALKGPFSGSGPDAWESVGPASGDELGGEEVDRVLRRLAEELVLHSPELAALLVAAGLAAEGAAGAAESVPGLPLPA